MRPAVVFALVLIVAAALLRSTSEAGGVRSEHGRRQKSWPLVYHYDQAHTATYISTIHLPEPGRLARLIFDGNTPGEGAGTVVFGVRRYNEVDAGYSDPICQVTIPCTAPAGPAGHYHPDTGFECDDGAEIGDEELLTVEVLSQDCAGSNTPEGNVTVYFEF